MVYGLCDYITIYTYLHGIFTPRKTIVEKRINVQGFNNNYFTSVCIHVDLNTGFSVQFGIGKFFLQIFISCEVRVSNFGFI